MTDWQIQMSVDAMAFSACFAIAASRKLSVVRRAAVPLEERMEAPLEAYAWQRIVDQYFIAQLMVDTPLIARLHELSARVHRAIVRIDRA